MRTILRNTRRGWMQFNEADKGGAAGSDPGKQTVEETPANPPPDPKAEPKKETVDAPEPAKVEASAAKPNVFTRAAAMIKDKSELLGTISAHEATIASLNSQLSTVNTALSAVTKERDELKSGAAHLEASITELTKEKKTVAQATVDQVAALGFDPQKLPAATSASADNEAPTSLEDFTAKHAELGKTDATAASKFYNQYAKKFGL